jgi:hypothetical protein
MVHRLDRSHQHDRISIEQNQPNPPLAMPHEPTVGYYQPMAAPMRWPTVVPMEAQLIENMRQMSLSMPMQPYSSWAQPEPWNRSFCFKKTWSNESQNGRRRNRASCRIDDDGFPSRDAIGSTRLSFYSIVF